MTTPGGIDGILAGLKGLAGKGQMAEQFFVWGILYGMVTAASAPFMQQLASDVNSGHPVMPISPADAADALLKGHMSETDAKAEAAKSGIDSNRFDVLFANAGEPPALGDMLSLFRRGEVTSDLLHKAVQQSAVRDEWFTNGTIQKLGKQPPTPDDFLNALLEGQIDLATAKSLYETFGGVTEQAGQDIFTILFNTRGNAPTPEEALTLVNRGIIPLKGTGPNAVTYEQAFLEGPWRNKWLPAFEALREYLPPPRTVTAMLGHGSLTDAQALDLLVQQGLTADLAAAYVSDAHHVKTAAQKDLALSEIATLYYDQAISADVAIAMIEPLGYSTSDAHFILDIQDLRRERKFLESAISRLHTLYADHKITSNEATGALASLKVPSSQVSNLLTTWSLERAANIPHLTESQYAAAFYYSVIDQTTAMAGLGNLGYQPHDAWVILSNRVHGPLPNEPSASAPITFGP